MRVDFIQGNDAIVLGALDAGCSFYAGYPITPSSEIAEEIAKLSQKRNCIFIQMEDEIASLGACIGASWAGRKAMTATSGPGFSLMQENIGYAVMTETPVVVVNIQRGGPSTGQATRFAQGDAMQARFGSHGDYETIVLAPWSVQECYDFTILAFNLSEKYRIPVILLADEKLAHMHEKVTLKKKKLVVRKKPKLTDTEFFGKNAPMPKLGEGFYVHVTGSTHKKNGIRDTFTPEVHEKLVVHLVNKIRKNSAKIISYEEKFVDDAKKLVVSYGVTGRPAYEAVLKARKKGLKVGFFRPKTLFPAPEKHIYELCINKDIILVQHSLCSYKYELERIVKKEIILNYKLGGEIHTSDEILKALSTEAH